MATFVERYLATRNLQPDEQQERLRREFARLLSPVQPWRYGDPVPPERILIGVALYALRELRMLDALKQSMRRPKECASVVQVFDILDVKDLADLQQYVPGIGKAYQTPVVGVWQGGEVVHTAWGLEALRWIETEFDFRVDNA